jgi:hypothetical protein
MLFDCVCVSVMTKHGLKMDSLLFCCVILVLLLDRVPKVILEFSDVHAIEIYCAHKY